MKKIYDTVFDEYLGLDLKGNYQVRLGPKIYLVKASTNYTPDLDKVFLVVVLSVHLTGIAFLSKKRLIVNRARLMMLSYHSNGLSHVSKRSSTINAPSSVEMQPNLHDIPQTNVLHTTMQNITEV